MVVNVTIAALQQMTEVRDGGAAFGGVVAVMHGPSWAAQE